MQIDKQNGNVAFCDSSHKYWDITDPNKKYVSVTTLIHSYAQDFDAYFWSAYKALEQLVPKESWAIEKKSLLNTHRIDLKILDIYNIKESDFNKAQQDILDEWERKKNESCERGTNIHAQLENSFYGDKTRQNTLKKLGIGGKFECKKNFNELILDKAIYPEYLISRDSNDGYLHLAGQIDVLVKDGNSITIIDWKGLPLDTEIPTKTGWKTIRTVKEGDVIFDKNGNYTKIVHKSKIHLNPCFKIIFDNGDSIVADCEHRWEISFTAGKSKKYPDGFKTCVMTTEEIFDYMENPASKKRLPKILNPKPLNTSYVDLPIDPYILGVWLGDGSKSCGMITQRKDSELWNEILRRGYKLGDNVVHSEDRQNVESRTILGLATSLKKLNLLNNKHIPYIYQRASYEQRLDLLRGLMDTDGYYNPTRKRFVMETSQNWQCFEFIKLLATFGIKPTKFDIVKKLGDKKFKEYSVNFSTNELNPFLIRNQDIEFCSKRTCNFRNIKSVEQVETVETQCLEVDSPTHTFLCTDKMIVTHNTNEKIDLKGGFNTQSKSSAKMKYPLNTLDDCNYNYYQLQLSTYAWMLQKINPNFEIKDLILYHFDHKGNETLYHCKYLKKEVERMLIDYKKKLIHEDQINKRKRIDY